MFYDIIIRWLWSVLPEETVKESVEKLSQEIREDGGNSVQDEHRVMTIRSYLEAIRANVTGGDELNKTYLSGLDFTFLHRLILHLSDGRIAHVRSLDIQNKKIDQHSAEFQLMRIKNLAGEILQSWTTCTQENEFSALQGFLLNGLDQFGFLCGMSGEEINIEKLLLMNMFHEIEIKGETSSELVKMASSTLVSTNCNGALEDLAEKIYLTLPKVNCEVDLTQHEKIHSDGSNKVIPSSQIFYHMDEKFAFISGGPGSGKTTLMKALFCKEVETKNSKSPDKRSFPLFVDSRTETAMDIGEYLKGVFPENLNRFDRETMVDALREMERVIFFIDGCDEANEESRELIRMIINFCEKGVSGIECLISGRMHGIKSFMDHSDKMARKYNCFSIQKCINFSKNKNFISRYLEAMDYRESKLLKEWSMKQSDEFRQLLTSPAMMLIYCNQCVRVYKSGENLRLSDIYEEIYHHILRDVEMKCKMSDSNDYKLNTRRIMRTVSRYSLDMFKENMSYFTKNKYEELATHCKEKNDRIKDIDGPLSSILCSNYPFHQTIEFIHPSLQEFFAAEQIVRNLVERNIQSKRIMPLGSYQPDTSSETLPGFEELVRKEENINRYIV